MSKKQENEKPKAEAKTVDYDKFGRVVEVKTVDYDKFSRVVEAKRGLERQVEELRAESATLAERAATADTLAQQVESWKAKAQEESTKFGRFQDIATRIGTTDSDAIEAVEWQYGRLGGEDRPALGDWLDAMTEKPDDAPAILRPFLVQRAEKVAPKTKAATAAPPAAGSQYSQDEIKAITAEAVRTGDWSTYRAVRKGWTR